MLLFCIIECIVLILAQNTEHWSDCALQRAQSGEGGRVLWSAKTIHITGDNWPVRNE